MAEKIATTQFEAENFLRIVVSAFGLPQQGFDKAAILEEIESFAIENHRIGRRPLLFVDELQNLPHSSLEELRERVITAYHLQPLDAEDTRRYIEHRSRWVVWAGDLRFSAEALLLILEQTGGIPRKINLICDRLLLFGTWSKHIGSMTPLSTRC